MKKESSMKSFIMPSRSRIDEVFPNNRKVLCFEGGAILAAEKEGKYFLIIDEGTMADFLLPKDYDSLDKLVTVYEFETEEEQQQFLLRYPAYKYKIEEGKNEP